MTEPSEYDVAAFLRELKACEAEAAKWNEQRVTAAASVHRLKWRDHYLRFVRWFRRPARKVPNYPLFVLLAGAVLMGLTTLVLLSFVVQSWLVAFGGMVLGALTGSTLIFTLLCQPTDELLPSALAETQDKLHAEIARLREIDSAVAASREQLASLRRKHEELIHSDKLQRAMLLQRNWKSLRGSEWEDYVVEVCRTLGANVQRGPLLNDVTSGESSPARGPRGVVRRPMTTLFVTFSPRRFAVAAVSEINPFHTAAVQQIVGELAQQGCEWLGIITNARVTAGSKELARSRHCTLIGEEEFPDFVLGKISL